MEWILVTLVGVALLGGGMLLAIILWFNQKSEERKQTLKREREAREREIAHEERMKSLAMGLPLPDAEVAQANAERSRARWSGLVGIFLPAGMMLIALGATVVLLLFAGGAVQIVGLCVVWGVAGLVSMFAAIGALTNLERPKQSEAKDQEQPAAPPPGTILEPEYRKRFRRREDI